MTKSLKNLKIFSKMHKLLKIFSLGGDNHNQKTSKSCGCFPENHCRAPPRGGVFFSSFWSQKRCKISKKFHFFSECINFWRFFHWEVKITARKPANLVDFFHENDFLWRGMPDATMKRHKNYKIFKKSQEFFQKS